MKSYRPNWKQFIVLGAFVVLFFLLMDLNNRLGDLSRLNTQLARMETEVGVLEATEAALSEQLAFSTSEAAVSEYARNHGMVQEGERLIVPLPLGTAEPQQTPEATPQSEFIRNRDVWWALFFGN